MNQFGQCFRNLLLFALVGWAGVDDYFPSVGSLADSGAESGEYSLFDGAGCRRASAAENLSPAGCCSLPIPHSIDSPGVLSAAPSARFFGVAPFDGRLYALMSLRR
jgi:hypothetical protein